MAAVVLGRLLTRPDMGPAMWAFLEWCPAALAEVDPLRQPFLLPGEGPWGFEGAEVAPDEAGGDGLVSGCLVSGVLGLGRPCRRLVSGRDGQLYGWG